MLTLLPADDVAELLPPWQLQDDVPQPGLPGAGGPLGSAGPGREGQTWDGEGREGLRDPWSASGGPGGGSPGTQEGPTQTGAPGAEQPQCMTHAGGLE